MFIKNDICSCNWWFWWDEFYKSNTQWALYECTNNISLNVALRDAWKMPTLIVSVVIKLSNSNAFYFDANWRYIAKIYLLQLYVEINYNTPMWHFGPCVTFRPCQCHFLDLPMWLFGPEAVPCQWHPPPRIKKINRNRIKIKRDNKNQFKWHK